MRKVPVWKAKVLFDRGCRIHITTPNDLIPLDWSKYSPFTWDEITTDIYHVTEVKTYYVETFSKSHILR